MIVVSASFLALIWLSGMTGVDSECIRDVNWCWYNSDCCSWNCASSLPRQGKRGVCQCMRVNGGEQCIYHEQCCSKKCENGQCRCTQMGGFCTVDDDCCWGDWALISLKCTTGGRCAHHKDSGNFLPFYNLEMTNDTKANITAENYIETRKSHKENAIDDTIDVAALGEKAIAKNGTTAEEMDLDIAREKDDVTA